MKDHELLGVGPTATLEEVKAAYKQRSLETHPDRGGSAEEFNRLHLAYGRMVERISNPRPRRCKGCRGRGKTTQTSGFFVVEKRCKDCRGRGVVK